MKTLRRRDWLTLQVALHYATEDRRQLIEEIRQFGNPKTAKASIADLQRERRNFRRLRLRIRCMLEKGEVGGEAKR